MDINQTLENLRVSYQAAELDVKDCLSNPIEQFDKWFKEANNSKCDEPNAFVLSTVKNNQPRSRVVLLKGLQNDQFIFYTNYKSAKGDEISLNDKVAMNFLWLPLQRQVRIEGVVSQVSSDLSDSYFMKRPRGSQLGAIASPQSKKVKDRKELEELFSQIEKKFETVEQPPRPAGWGGYGITPTYIEFWQGRNNRLHDRICFERTSNGWEIYRLAP